MDGGATPWHASETRRLFHAPEKISGLRLTTGRALSGPPRCALHGAGKTTGKRMFQRIATAAAVVLLGFTSLATAQSQQPLFATTKVEGTDNVYIFRYQFHQSMFV